MVLILGVVGDVFRGYLIPYSVVVAVGCVECASTVA